MILDDKHFKELERFDALLRHAAANNGKGSMSYLDMQFLTSLYYQITNDRVCFSCNRDWLWRLGIWYLETLDNVQEKPIQRPKRVKRTDAV